MSGFLVDWGRRLARARRRSVWLRRHLPFRVINRASRARSLASQVRYLHTRVEYRSSSVNVYHCCVVKTGSQWVQALLSDLATFRYSGLTHYHYLSRMYDDYACFAALPKPESYKAFFVMRDPRDVVVSWYYSSRYSHLVMGDDIRRIRDELEALSVRDGLLYSIDHLADYGLFDSLRAWSEAPELDPRVAVVRYEDLVSPRQLEVLGALFRHLDLGLPGEQLDALLDAHSFARVSGGRRRGEEDKRSHIRRGTGGDWRELFDGAVTRRLDERAGDLAAWLGYPAE